MFLALALTACSSTTQGRRVPASSSASGVTIALPMGSTASATRHASVPLGQDLVVAYVRNDYPGYWALTSAGSMSVLRALPEVVTGCDSKTAGCPTRHRAPFRAVARGRTTVVWTFAGTPAAGRNVITIDVTVT